MKCCNCKSSEEVEPFVIENRGYDSQFDGDIFSLNFCSKCISELKINNIWFDNEYCYRYENGEIICLYEENLLELFNKLPSETRELINNCYNIHQEFAKAYN